MQYAGGTLPRAVSSDFKIRKTAIPVGITVFLVEEGGFEPPKLTQQIYSLPPLATRELLQI